MNYFYSTDLTQVKELQEKESAWIDIHRVGIWHHPVHGLLKGTVNLFKAFIDNWKKNVLGRQVIFDKSHNPDDGGTGFLEDMKIENGKLRAFVKFTKFGLELIRKKGFIYFSPEYTDNYTSKDTGKKVGPTLLGGALTSRPFLTNLEPIILSEAFCNIYYPQQETVNNNLNKLFEEAINEIITERKLTDKDLQKSLLGIFNKI